MPARKKSMSSDHRAALAISREQGRAVRAYLEALDAHQPKGGRRRTPESIEKRLARIEHDLPEANVMRRVALVQERINLTAEWNALQSNNDMADLEAAFVEAAAGYSDRKGITYAAWREVGVPAAVLNSAGIARGG